MAIKKGLQEFDRKAEGINKAVKEAKNKQESLKQEICNLNNPIKPAKINF